MNIIDFGSLKNKKMFTSKSSSIDNSAGSDKNTGVIEKAPIYTMRKDLEKAKNPQILLKEEYESSNSSRSFDKNKKSSPFFGSQQQVMPIEKTAPISPTRPLVTREVPVSVNSIGTFPGQRSINQREALKFNETSGKTRVAWKKIVLIALFLFILLSIGFGGYYFWITRSGDLSNISISGFLSKNTPSEKILPLSTKTPNYLNIDIEKTDKNELKTLADKYSKEMTGNGIVSPVEFIVSDLKNNPIDFSVFSKKIGLSLSQEIISKLDKNFSLFLYNDTDKPRLGLVITTEEGEKLRAALAQEEANLPEELQDIFLAPYSLEAKTFKTSSYNGIAIRYLNIVSPEEISIDYTVSGNQLIIGTTKMTLRSIIDYMNSR